MAKFALLAIMILNGIFFTVNIYVLGDRTAAIAMHLDLAPTAGTLMVNAKVLVTFIAGILYLLAAFGLVRKRPGFLLSGVVACILFNGLYAVEIVKWGSFHPWVWKGFFTAGGLSFLIGACSYVFWKKGAI
jgi:hypothetical protein